MFIPSWIRFSYASLEDLFNAEHMADLAGIHVLPSPRMQMCVRRSYSDRFIRFIKSLNRGSERSGSKYGSIFRKSNIHPPVAYSFSR